jgi:hypothetical protein
VTGRTGWAPIIERAAEIVYSYATSVTLRQLFYRLVSEQVIPNTQTAYKRLSALTAEARRAGEFPDLIDRGREIHCYAHWPDIVSRIGEAVRNFRLDRTEGQGDSGVLLLALRRHRVDRPVHDHLPDPVATERGPSVRYLTCLL